MKKWSKKYHTLLLTAIVITLLILITFGILVIRSTSKKTNSDSPTQPNQTDIQKMQQKEIEVTKDIDSVTNEYFKKQYPQATEISKQNEFVGMGYGIINISYTLEGAKQNRKIYLKYMEPDWVVLYESEDKITCDKVRELINTETILTSLCE